MGAYWLCYNYPLIDCHQMIETYKIYPETPHDKTKSMNIEGHFPPTYLPSLARASLHSKVVFLASWQGLNINHSRLCSWIRLWEIERGMGIYAMESHCKDHLHWWALCTQIPFSLRRMVALGLQHLGGNIWSITNKTRLNKPSMWFVRHFHHVGFACSLGCLAKNNSGYMGQLKWHKAIAFFGPIHGLSGFPTHW